MIHERLLRIIVMLQDNPVSMKRFCDTFNLKERTIRKDIADLNVILAPHAEILNERPHGYRLTITNPQEVSILLKQSTEMVRLDSSEDRIQALIRHLILSGTPTTEEEMLQLAVISEKTLYNYLKNIELYFKSHSLVLIKNKHGYLPCGEEEKLRTALFDVVSTSQDDLLSFSPIENQLFQFTDYPTLEQLISRFFSRFQSDFHKKSFLIKIAIIVLRLKNGMTIIKSPSLSNEVNNVGFINELEDTYGINIHDFEAQGIQKLILTYTLQSQLESSLNDSEIKIIVDNLLHSILANYQINLLQDTLLKQDLFEHLRVLLAASSNLSSVANPLLEMVKTNYPVAYEVTRTSVRSLQQLSYLSDDEIGYLSLHIGAALERKKLNLSNALIVCGSGKASSRMLETLINLRFSTRIKVIGIYSYHEYMEKKPTADFIITTIRIEADEIPVIKVDLQLLEEDIQRIHHFLDTSSTTVFDDYFSEERFAFYTSIPTVTDLITTMNQMFIDSDFVDKDHLQSVFDREALGPTTVDPHTLVLHALKPIAKQTGVGVVLLAQPLYYGESEINTVFMVSVAQTMPKDYTLIYDYILKCVGNRDYQHKLNTLTTFHKFKNYLLSL